MPPPGIIPQSPQIAPLEPSTITGRFCEEDQMPQGHPRLQGEDSHIAKPSSALKPGIPTEGAEMQSEDATTIAKFSQSLVEMAWAAGCKSPRRND